MSATLRGATLGGIFSLTMPVAAQAQQALPVPAVAASSASAASATTTRLQTVTVNASADASAQGLSPVFPGGQVARGGRAGILGTRDNMETPFSITSYTHQRIQDAQAKSVGEVLLDDPTVRVARGFGNFQESYFIRGFLLNSDDVAYNGLYSLLPRQYIATELFERVEVLRGASTFLNGVSPGGDGIGGAINLVPKRAPNQPLTEVTLGYGSGGAWSGAADIARRFGPDKSTGLRLNAAVRGGGTGIDDERARTSLIALGADWRSRDVRLSADLGFQDNKLKRTRTNVTLAGTETVVPRAPDASSNWAQPWSYSNERDLFGTLRGEWDLRPGMTAWAAYGLRRSNEANSLANLDLADSATAGSTGAATVSRFDNTRKDHVDTGEIGLRGKLQTGPVGHDWVVSAALFRLDKRAAYSWDYFNTLATNLYAATLVAQPPFSGTGFAGNDLNAPARTELQRLTSVAVGDTLAMFDDRFLVTLGARWQKIDTTDYAFDTGAATGYEKSRSSPVVGAVVRFGTQLSLYGNYIEGLSPGETAPAFVTLPQTRPPLNQGQQLSPYVSKQKEIGLKYESGNLGATLALFSTKRPRAYIDASNVFTAAGDDRHQGAELGVFGRLTPSLRWLGGATWLDAEQQNTGSSATDGKRVIGVPRTLANLGLDYDLPFVTGLSVDGRVVYTGARYADAVNALRVPGWTRLDLGLRYIVEVQGRSVTLRGRVDNVAGRDYWSSVGGYPGSGYLVLGSPRVFSLTASVDL